MAWPLTAPGVIAVKPLASRQEDHRGDTSIGWGMGDEHLANPLLTGMREASPPQGAAHAPNDHLTLQRFEFSRDIVGGGLPISEDQPGSGHPSII